MTYHRVSHRQSDRGIFSINVPSSELTLAYIKLEKKSTICLLEVLVLCFILCLYDIEPVVQDIPVIPALGRVGQEKCEFEAILGYMVRLGPR